VVVVGGRGSAQARAVPGRSTKACMKRCEQVRRGLPIRTLMLRAHPPRHGPMCTLCSAVRWENKRGDDDAYHSFVEINPKFSSVSIHRTRLRLTFVVLVEDFPNLSLRHEFTISTRDTRPRRIRAVLFQPAFDPGFGAGGMTNLVFISHFTHA